MPYVLGKVKRTVSGQKVGDLVDQSHPTSLLTDLADNDEFVVIDVSGSTKTIKVIQRSSFMTWLNALVAPTWAKITGRPSTFTPSSHTHSYASVTGKPTTFPPSSHTHSMPPSPGSRRRFRRRHTRHSKDQVTGLGTAATKDVGTDSGKVPVLDSDGHLENARLSGIPTGSLADDVVTQAKMADDAVGSGQLRTGTYNQSGRGYFTLPSNTLTFLPVPGGTSTDNNDHKLFLAWSFDSNASAFGRARWIRSNRDSPGDDPTDTIASSFKYVTSSDRPSLWVVLDADGAVVGMWEAEDPVSTGDTVEPLSGPVDGDGNRLPGYTIVDVGLPSHAVIAALYDALTATQQAQYVANLSAYIVDERGWLDSLTTLADLQQITPRYEPSGRQWAVRTMADVLGIGVTELYQTRLQVGSDNTWESRVD